MASIVLTALFALLGIGIWLDGIRIPAVGMLVCAALTAAAGVGDALGYL